MGMPYSQNIEEYEKALLEIRKRKFSNVLIALDEQSKYWHVPNKNETDVSFLYPHVDCRILHSPTYHCSHCEEFPSLIEARVMWGINFTDTDDPELAPCPSKRSHKYTESNEKVNSAENVCGRFVEID